VAGSNSPTAGDGSGWGCTIVLILVIMAVSVGYDYWRPQRHLTLAKIQTLHIGGVLSVTDFKIINAAKFDLKDPVISCDVLGQSGSTIETISKTLYETLPAHQTWTSDQTLVMGPTSDQVVEFKCRISGANVK
jgi:hypothetical protein